MAEQDTAALVETALTGIDCVLTEGRYEEDHQRHRDAATDAVHALAQCLADMTENEEHAVRAFKAAEAHAERAEEALRAHHQPNADFTLTLLHPGDAVAVCATCHLVVTPTEEPATHRPNDGDDVPVLCYGCGEEWPCPSVRGA